MKNKSDISDLDLRILQKQAKSEEEFKSFAARRAKSEPVAYILGTREFWSIPIKVTPDVLIPRPETKHLVERALAKIPADKVVHILDVGTGSGCIIAAL